MLATIALASAGCTSGGSDTPPGTAGEAGYGVFRYLCVGEGDAVCNQTTAVNQNVVAPDLGIDGQIPRLMAVGGRFDLSYHGGVPEEGGYALPVTIVPARSDVVQTTGGFSFTSPATVAFLARNEQGTTVDFIHVSSTTAAALDLWWSAERVTALELAQPGTETSLGVVAVDDDGVSLGGALGYEWSSLDEDVVRLGQPGSVDTPVPGLLLQDDEVRVVGMAEGETTVRVVLGSLVEDLTVTVGPEVAP